MTLTVQSLAPPTRCPRCDALVREDTHFSRDAVTSQQPQRRYVCTMGHSVYTGVVEHSVAMGPLPNHRKAARQQQKTCRWCHDPFVGLTRQGYCSTVCARAADTARGAVRWAI